MSKKKVLVRRFECYGSGDDSPSHGFEVVKSKGVHLRRNSTLTSDNLAKLVADKVDVVFVK